MTESLPHFTGAQPSGAHAKALAINLDPTSYGTFAEIGAGQEVARWFLRVGGAAGTIAQTISAYDKTFSDDTYGSGSRYVSKERLAAMLDHEYELLLNRLAPVRGQQTRFFVFADTVAARNYRGDNEQHGWLGIRFQTEPGGPPNNLLFHVNLRDHTAQLQQEALGVFGVNLIYAAFFQCDSRETFLAGAFDGLSIDRIELDVIELAGPAFDGADARRACLTALRRGMCHALVFDPSGSIVEPSAMLRKRPLIVERGRFVAPDAVYGAMMRASEQQLCGEGIPLGRDPTSIFEMSIRPVAGTASDDDDVLLRKVAHASGVGSVIVSDFPETYLLIEYLRRYTTEPVRLVVGVSNVARLMAEEFYTALPGSLLEGLGRLLASNVKVYVQPMPKAVFDAALQSLPGLVEATSDPVTADAISFKPPVEHLYRYMRDAQWVVPLRTT
ncbi:MAG: hypothetical protein WBD40_05545 [Tepidisphaeraceae bacterium]